eukprot:scaffold12181_cov213-Isochrysis_galbana.AAC.3
MGIPAGDGGGGSTRRSWNTGSRREGRGMGGDMMRAPVRRRSAAPCSSWSWSVYVKLELE